MSGDSNLNIVHNNRDLSWYSPSTRHQLHRVYITGWENSSQPSSFAANKMTDKKMPSKPSTEPVIYLHAKGCEQASKAHIQALLELGLPLCNRLANGDMVQTVHGFDQPGPLLVELADRFPGRPVVFLRAGLQPSKHQLDQLTSMLEQADQPLALTLLSNAETTVNPFAGLLGPEPNSNGDLSGDDLAGLVSLLAPGNLHTLTAWADHFTFL